MSDPADAAHPVSQVGNQPGTVARQDITKGNNPSQYVVERTRAWTGVWVVAAGDVAIIVAAVWGVIKAAGSTTSSSTIVAILTSAFTAVGTMTTAYFGIKSSANTAQYYRTPAAGPPHAGPPHANPPPTDNPPTDNPSPASSPSPAS